MYVVCTGRIMADDADSVNEIGVGSFPIFRRQVKPWRRVSKRGDSKGLTRLKSSRNCAGGNGR